jgi:hypothetical protein
MPYYIYMANSTGDRKAEPTTSTNTKVNLNNIKANLVKRGKPPYENPVLVTDILSLDPTVEGDAFFWTEAVVNLSGTAQKVQAEKMKYRNRALSVAEKLGVTIAINWLDDGKMVISLGSAE